MYWFNIQSLFDKLHKKVGIVSVYLLLIETEDCYKG